MKRYNYYNATLLPVLLAAIMLSSAGKVQAQQKIDPTVEVEKEFDGKMTNIVKGALNSSIPDSLTSFNLNFNYSIFDKPYKDLYEFSPLPSAQLQGKVKEKYPVLMAKAGLGLPLMPFAAVTFQPELKEGNSLVLNASYDGYFGKNRIAAKGPDGKAGVLKEGADGSDAVTAATDAVLGTGIMYGYNWKRGWLRVGADYSNNFYTYYGFSENSYMYEKYTKAADLEDRKYMKDNLSHRYNQAAISMRVGSSNGKEEYSRFSYNFGVLYRFTSDKVCGSISELFGMEQDKLGENYIKADGEISPANGRYNRFSIGINSENSIYSGLQEYKYGIYEITPQYSFEKGRFAFKAGVKLSGRYKSKDFTDDNHKYFFVKAGLQYNIVKEKLWFVANIDGGNHLNNYSTILEYNKWISPLADIKAGSTPFLVDAGLRGKAYGKLGYDISVKYAVHKGLIQYVNAPSDNMKIWASNAVMAIYSDHNEFTAKGSVYWKSKRLDAGTEIRYTNWTDGKKGTFASGLKPFGYAPFAWKIYGTYNWLERIYVGIGAELRSATPISVEYGTPPESSYWDEDSANEFTAIERDSVLDLNVNAKYVINNNFSVFVHGKNLLNAQIEYLPNYLEKGISFTAGVLVKL